MTALAEVTQNPTIGQGPPPQQPDGPNDDPRPEQPHPLDEPGEDEPPQPVDPGTDQQVGA